MTTSTMTQLDEIEVTHPALKTSRVWLAGIERGAKIMARYPEMSDEWLCGNSEFSNSANEVRKIVGEAESLITKSIVGCVRQALNSEKRAAV